MRTRLTRLTGLALLGLLVACSSNTRLAFEFIGFLPVFYVVENPVNPTRARELALALGIETSIIASDGSIRYLDKHLFQHLPMVPVGPGPADEEGHIPSEERFDFEAIRAIQPLAADEARLRAVSALQKAGLNPRRATISVGHSRFQAVSVRGEAVADVALDTQVDFDTVTPNNYPLRGPGASIKVVFDGQGKVTQLQYAYRVLAEGSRAAILSGPQAQRRAAAQYFGVDQAQVTLQGQCARVQAQAGSLCLQSELVYYAPPMGLSVTQIAPHYLFSGRFSLDGTTVEIRRLLIPALANAPEVGLSVTSDGSLAVEGRATVSGGKAPYSYSWASATTALPLHAQEHSIRYNVSSREAVSRETLSVVVTDAEGISTWASQVVMVNAPAPMAKAAPQAQAPHTVGAAWVGASQNLPYSARNVGGFLSQASEAGVQVAFNFGEQLAYQSDFARETDSFGIDSVDLGFYTGHANGLGFSFVTERKKRFFYSEQASWGERDLEWLLIAACGPLQESEFGIPWWRQWGGAFNGLHLLLGYANTTYDNSHEGLLLGQGIFEQKLPLRQAWANAASSIQTPAEIYAVMGVWDARGVNNYNDHFWNLGPVGPDIPGPSVEGFWRLSGPS
ncbi:DUF6345 domain-containing protein [Meiothermus cerbereus]|uniref:DUF6345 domain-containing protein n=1 Tax=Meiothermus cerbereus TaxID=65552 RepID=UPI0004819E28|nr:DUF6345 domain-containing protein [Meiothermus cerbereus]